jgi:AAA15 family ATPase/GTPase
MAEHISELEIKNFRRFDYLTAKNLGQFNLIVGDNNVGKTSFLEALLFDIDLPVWLNNLYAALSYRDIEFEIKEFNPLDFYFHDQSRKIIETTIKNYTEGINQYRLETIPSSELAQSDLDRLNLKNLGRRPSRYSAILSFNNIKIDTQFVQDVYGDGGYVPFISSSNIFDEDLIDYYSGSIQRRRSLKEELIRNLSILIPGIENIEVSENSTGKTFLVTLKGEELSQIINAYGEGTIRLLRVLLEVYMCREKRIMIDEFGSGIHYSRLEKFFSLVLESCVKNDVQLFATTHSKECIENFTAALRNLHLESKGRILRLADTAGGIKMYTYTFEQFESALQAESEIR